MHREGREGDYDDLPANLAEHGVGEGGRVGGENLRDVLASRKRRSRAHSLANVCSFCYQYELAASAVSFVGIHTGVERIGTPAERHYVALTVNAPVPRWRRVGQQ